MFAADDVIDLTASKYVVLVDEASIWSTNLLAPAIITGKNAVTNPIAGARQFYRLIR